MRNFFFTLLVFTITINAGNSYGQQTVSQVGHQTNSQVIDNTILSGHFEIGKANKEKGIVEHINVNYAISPVPFSNVLNLELSTPDPAIFSADIADLNGVKLIQWRSARPDYRNNSQIDISKLKPGNYQLNIYWDKSGGLLHSIPFQKTGNE